MEKKVTRKFYLFSTISLIPAILLGWGVLNDTLILIVILAALVLNHAVLVRLIAEVSQSLTGSNVDAKRSLRRSLLLMFFKFALIGGILALTYYYDPALVPKVMLLMIFQLIIQVVSIKNNY